MNKETLVLRNRSMAEAFHRPAPKHQARRALLTLVGRTPIPTLPTHNRNRILLIRPDHLGDVLLTTPALYALREVNPYTEIHALVGPWSADAIAAYPEIDLALTLVFPGFSREPKENWRSPYQLALQTAGRLRKIGYSSAIIFRPDHWWGALVAKLAGIPERIGYNLPDVAPFLTQAIEHRPEHVVWQSLRLIEPWTGELPASKIVYRFPVDPVSEGYVNGYLQEWGIAPDQPIICIHPGTGTWVKHWLEERWADAADTLADQLEAAVVFTGGDHELALVRRIASQMHRRACIMAGDTRIGQLAAVFKRAKVVLGPDSGPLHLAAAVGTPTVSLFGPADPQEFGPWGPPRKHLVLGSDIGCRPCRVLDWGADSPEFHPCVRDITLARVLDAARRAVTPA